MCGADIAAAQLSEATDTAGLRDFAAGSDDDRTATWTAGTSPCGAGWDHANAGWKGVTCCANGHYDCTGGLSRNARRVTHVEINGRPGVRGDLADLAGLTELQVLGLPGTSAHGDIAALLGLTLLTGLSLAGAPVYGDAAAIRATIPGLSTWGTGQDAQYGHYTACSAFECQYTALGTPSNAIPIAGAADVVGNDADVCCVPGALFLRACCFHAPRDVVIVLLLNIRFGVIQTNDGSSSASADGFWCGARRHGIRSHLRGCVGGSAVSPRRRRNSKQS